MMHIFDEQIDDRSMDLEGFVKALRREFGRMHLNDGIEHVNDFDHFPFTRRELFSFIVYEKDDDLIVDAIELFCSEKLTGLQPYMYGTSFSDVVAEVNTRLAESGVGFEFIGGQILRKDSQLIHKEVVIPALNILASDRFAGANAEYRAAHGHFRRSEYGDVLSECSKCFESTMKVICDQRGWAYDREKATTKTLVDLIIVNELVSKSTVEFFTALPALLRSVIATPRNRLDGHGAGSSPHAVPKEMAAYLLHQTAAAVVFLVDSAGMR
jgi:hypothetical protein